MKNIRYSKRLLTIFLAGAISLTTTACTMKKNDSTKYVSPVEAESVVLDDKNKEGIITLTDNVIDMLEDVSLDTQEAIVVSEPINEVMQMYAYDGSILYDYHCKAATLHESNVRIGPGTEYEKITSLCRGTILEVIGKTASGWCLVRNNGQEYYTIESNITMLNYLYDGMTMEDMVPNLALAIQPTTNLNVRQEPRKDSTKLGLISGNRTYKVLDHSNGWYKIDYQGMVAYVKDDYCRETYILDGRFYQYVSATHDCILYDENGNPKRYLEKYEGGPVYNENSESYLIWVGDEWGYVRREDVRILHGRIIDVDDSLQQVTVYNGSEMIVQMDGCTGKASTPTDRGIHTLRAETGPTVLEGPGYSCPVENFAGFNGGEGFHPYKCNNFGDVNGAASHGCVRLRPDRYTEFFDATFEGDTVVVHK